MQYDVSLTAQRTGMGCWAASIAMILGWKSQASFDPHLIAANSGGLNYTPSLTTGLNPNDRYILQRNGFTVEEPMCYTTGAIDDLLVNHGPLWLAALVQLPGTSGLSPHIRVITGMKSGRVFINDPWPVNVGARYSASFATIFVNQMESLGASEMREPAPIYLAHL